MSTYIWEQVFPATTPDSIIAVRLGLFVYDTARDRGVVWSYQPSPARLTTWEYYGGDWHAVTTATAPNLIGSTTNASCYDEANSNTVLAVNKGGGVRETWTYDGANWTLMSPATGLGNVITESMAFDKDNNICVFVGFDGGGVLETWTWDGATWAHIAPTGTLPAFRADYGFSYYDPGGYFLFYSGTSGFDETWKLDITANTWTLLTPATTFPTALVPFGSYDPTIGKLVVLTSGPETWTWDGTDWTQETPTPDMTSPRGWVQIVYNADVGETMAWGGDDGPNEIYETWFLRVPTVQSGAYQRVFGWRAVIDDNALETIELLVSPSAGDA